GERQKPKLEQRGDIARGLREADVVLEAEYRTQTALHNALEPHGCTALWQGDRLTVYESTQGIFAVRNEVAEKLGLAAEHVRLITEHMGGGFGAKQGAYSVGGEDSDVIGTYLTLYRCANVRAEQTALATHLGPAVAFRAPGYAEGNFALESAIDELAGRLGIDAVELRLRNYTTNDQREGKPFTSGDSLRRCIARIVEGCEWQRKRPGLGFAAHDWAAGGGWPPAEV